MVPWKRAPKRERIIRSGNLRCWEWKRVYFPEHSRRTCQLPSTLLCFIVAREWYVFNRERHSRAKKSTQTKSSPLWRTPPCPLYLAQPCLFWVEILLRHPDVIVQALEFWRPKQSTVHSDICHHLFWLVVAWATLNHTLRPSNPQTPTLFETGRLMSC